MPMCGLLSLLGVLSVLSVCAYVLHFALHAAWASRWLGAPRSALVRGAQWAVITGGSSGIGAALARRCCEAGTSVLLVARDDDLLVATTRRLRDEFGGRVEVRSVGADLGDRSGAFMAQIERASDDVLPTLVFNNAGYIRVGLFVDDPVDAALHCAEVNALSALRITHHFANRMVNANAHGAICFTSSASQFIPNPMSAMYGATKAFLSSLATSLAAELRPCGISVTVIHPSPVNTNFYNNSRGLSFLDSAKKSATSAEVVADAILSAVGRTVVKDQGWFTFGVRLLLKVVDFNVLAEVIAAATAHLGEYWKLKKPRS